MIAPTYTYAATVVKVIDGDTIDLSVDVGFRASIAIRTRLRGINAPELNTAEGKVTRDYVRSILRVGDPVVVRTYKDPRDKYGRWLADIVPAHWQETLNDGLVRGGLAEPYDEDATARNR